MLLSEPPITGPVDSIEEAVQIQRAHPDENVTLEDIVEEFELQAEVRKTR
jgi:hypothetical protein